MNKIDTTCEHLKLRLIAAAVGLQQCARTETNLIPLPGGERIVAIGTPAEVARLLEIAPASADNPSTAGAADLHNAIMNLRCDVQNCILGGAPAEMAYKMGHRDARHAAAELAIGFKAAPVAQSTAGAAKAIGWITTGDIEYGIDGAEVGDWDVVWDHKLIDSMPEFCVPETTYGVYLAAPAAQAPAQVPDILFDGHAVYSEITRHLGKSHCHSAATVTETLDAVVRLLRAASKDQQSALGEKGGE